MAPWRGARTSATALAIGFLLAAAAAPVAALGGLAAVPLRLEPDGGPRDGGTVVRVQVLELNVSEAAAARSAWRISLRPVRAGGRGGGLAQRQSARVVNATPNGGGFLTFVTPDLSAYGQEVAGVLVSLLPRSGGEGDLVAAAEVLDAPALFFRLYASMAALKPVVVLPCCELWVSGGEEILISGGPEVASGPPSARPLLRLRGAERQETFDAELVAGSLHAVKDDIVFGDSPGNMTDPTLSLGQPSPAKVGGQLKQTETPNWHLRAISPQWPKAEGHLVLELSWNRQQFAPFNHRLRFVEDDNFFGEVAGGISEEHLSQGSDKVQPEASPPRGASAEVLKREMVAVVGKTDAALGQRGSSVPLDRSQVLLRDHDGNFFVMMRSRDLSHLQDDLELVHDLLLLTCAAALGGALAVRCGTPSVIGFVLGGAAAGPGGLDLVKELVQVESVGEIGICLILFSLGLEVSLQELLANKRAAIASLLAIVLLCCSTVTFAAFFTHTSSSEALCIGLFASLSSTPVSLRAMTPLTPGRPKNTDEMSVLLAVLITQDVMLALLLAVLPQLLQEDSGGDSEGSREKQHDEAWVAQHMMGVVVCVQVSFVFLAGVLLRRHTMGNMLDGVRRTARTVSTSAKTTLLRMDDESFALVVLSFAFALAYTTDCLGISVELGAFIAGVILTLFSEQVAERAGQRIGGLKDFFAALFFASIGLVINGRFLFDNLAAILSVVGYLFVLKTVTLFVPLRAIATAGSTSPAITSFRVAAILAHVGEFGFIFAAKGESWDVLPRHVYLLLVGANAVSLCLTPSVMRVLNWVLPRQDDAPFF